MGSVSWGGEKCKDDNGDTGRCHTRGYRCQCLTSKDEAKEHYINIMYDPVQAALPFPQVKSTLGPTAACSQLRLLV